MITLTQAILAVVATNLATGLILTFKMHRLAREARQIGYEDGHDATVVFLREQLQAKATAPARAAAAERWQPSES